MGNTGGRNGCQSPSAVHPHARGEHDLKTAWENNTDGSSPRTWGTRLRRPRPLGSRRFIPTHVGNTGARRAGICSRAVHPHARGEHFSAAAPPCIFGGSSPRTWGTPVLPVAIGRVQRFIPTHVGNTLLACCTTRPRPVHPHARGEHRISRAMATCRSGSSPRTWGTPVASIVNE